MISKNDLIDIDEKYNDMLNLLSPIAATYAKENDICIGGTIRVWYAFGEVVEVIFTNWNRDYPQSYEIEIPWDYVLKKLNQEEAVNA